MNLSDHILIKKIEKGILAIIENMSETINKNDLKKSIKKYFKKIYRT